MSSNKKSPQNNTFHRLDSIISIRDSLGGSRDPTTNLFPPLNLPVRHHFIDGLAYPISCPPDRVTSSDLFDPRDGDVVVSGYPRSGTSLALALCREIHLLQNPKLPRDHPFFLDLMPRDQMPWIHSTFSTSNLDKIPSPRVFKTRNHYQHLNLNREKVKVIHVIRNPKDTVCAQFSHMAGSNSKSGFRGTFEDAITWFLSRGFDNGCYWTFNRGYLENRSQFNMLVVSYEEMVLRKSDAITRINRFLGYDELDKEEVRFVDRVTEHALPKPGRARELLSFSKRCVFDERCRKEFDGVSEDIPESYFDEEIYLNQC
eukprot:sb/3466986/